MNQIYCGDIRDIAKTLPAQSVNCIVTSPPYFGLRDYGTANWEGGKAECDHLAAKIGMSNKNTLGHNGHLPETNSANVGGKKQYRDICPKCGAKRIDKQIGLEESPEAYVNTLVDIFRELRRVLRDDGTVWLNLGDSYANTKVGNTNEAPDKRPRPYFENGTHQMNFKKTIPDGMKPKNLLGIPWRVAFALQGDGWILRSDIIWHKKNPMPESVKDRPTKAHEYIFLLSKKAKYYYDNEAIKEPSVDLNGSMSRYKYYFTGRDDLIMPDGDIQRIAPKGKREFAGNRNRRTVWSVSTKPYKQTHFAVFPPDLIRPCILAGCPQQVCGECGKPWERVVEKNRVRNGATPTINGRSDIKQGNTAKLSLPKELRTDTNRSGMGTPSIKTLGWQPACNCNADTTPGIILDPFMGSGTVAQVAIETGRNWLGVELNPEYIELANKRIAQTQPALPIEAVLW